MVAYLCFVQRRKLEREQKKQRRSKQHNQPQPPPQPAQPSAPKAQASKKRPRTEGDDHARPAKHAVPFKDPHIEAEEKEIERLEKLLGLGTSGDKSKEQKKLKKELAKDGFGDDFGDFLARLDKIGSGDFGKEEERALRGELSGSEHGDDSDEWESEVDEDDPFDDDIPRVSNMHFLTNPILRASQPPLAFV